MTIGKSQEMASEFVNTYPLMFTEDKGFWVEKLAELLRKYGSHVADEINNNMNELFKYERSKNQKVTQNESI